MFEAIFLGALQGLTEFLPISSSAHIRIAGELFGTNADPGATFTAITQIGTELAVLIYFRKDIVRIISAWFSQVSRKQLLAAEKADARLGWLIIIGTLPIVALGYFGQEIIRNDFRSLWLIATTLIVFGIILGIADKYGKTERQLHQLTPVHGVLYGFAQSLALIPGVSRSGATIAMGRFMGYSREAALRYSFLLALPAVFGSGLYELNGALGESASERVFSLPETFVATAIAFVTGYAVIAWLLKYVTTKSFAPFILYRIALGSLLILLLSLGVIS
ncbi:undecaprenyl-diphosphate phosphatase [Candidatus Planktophila lacus]|jgi:undecaprenyl-diphosphatase|uniref:Undecaprenyl-diphosphatase n=1 Tax=Candidatus Planktophila lacus TaxID=1884913 RepID=A0AAD0DYB0_9ACTN|nr:undecaprenyl-diphosphate phosphatase [Candidatus Planktophila lacus]ASY10277.1 undecaprenyl-diphosphatase [Candidatus Planktophila lacus]